jgi:hypothetical protein
MADPKIEKWSGWCEGRLRAEITAMHLHRHVMRELARIDQEHGDLPASYFWEYLLDTYAITQATAIRRQVDPTRDVCCLLRLLTEIGADAALITKRRYIENHDPAERDEAERRFAEKFGGKVGERLDPQIVASDREVLVNFGAPIKGYVDEHIAHSSPEIRDGVGVPRFDALDDAIDGITNVFTKYTEAVIGKTWPVLVPEIQHDWQAVFREPWIRAG